jgi:NADPH-dependent 2,4-dienoyl-CoA reductase/sulfur reductase-like enzyme
MTARFPARPATALARPAAPAAPLARPAAPLVRPAAPVASLARPATALARPAADCQVLVVGAGPTGLVLAAELLARGIGVRLIDQGDGVALQARAIGIHARTL